MWFILGYRFLPPGLQVYNHDSLADNYDFIEVEMNIGIITIINSMDTQVLLDMVTLTQ